MAAEVVLSQEEIFEIDHALNQMNLADAASRRLSKPKMVP